MRPDRYSPRTGWVIVRDSDDDDPEPYILQLSSAPDAGSRRMFEPTIFRRRLAPGWHPRLFITAEAAAQAMRRLHPGGIWPGRGRARVMAARTVGISLKVETPTP